MEEHPMSFTKRRLPSGVGMLVAAAATFTPLLTSTASAASDVTPPAGISVQADTAGASAVLIASLEGRNELTPVADGQALALIGIHDDALTYAVAWRGTGTPTAVDIHAGARGVDGPIVVPLFTTPRPAGGVVSGTVDVDDPALLAALRSDPSDFYADLHTDRLPNGAARAQLHLLTHAAGSQSVAALQEPVVIGSQIYACTMRADGSFAFTQHDVEARLGGGIHHTFVQPDAGPPQWQAPDGSAVSGKVANRNDNGAGNIAELNLDATQIGQPTGLLGDVVEVLRLNTVGGVAPAGTCDPQATPTINVPYQADYVFINAEDLA
jgi:hypothetical protein